MSQTSKIFIEDDVPHIDPDVWKAIYPTISKKDFKSKVIITSTPKGITPSNMVDELNYLMGLVRKLIDLELITGRVIKDDEYECIISFYVGGGSAYTIMKKYAMYSHQESTIEIFSVGYRAGKNKINNRIGKESINVFQLMYLIDKVKKLISGSLF